MRHDVPLGRHARDPVPVGEVEELWAQGVPVLKSQARKTRLVLSGDQEALRRQASQELVLGKEWVLECWISHFVSPFHVPKFR